MIPDTVETHSSGQVPAAESTLRILLLLAGRAAPVAASTIARELTLPRSTVYHLLNTLAAHGFVLHFREDRRWGLGTSAFELAGGYSRQQPLARLGRPVIAALADRLGESAHLAVMSGGDVLYIVEERAPRRPALVTDVGVRLPAHLTASGRAMLAALPREQVRALYPSASDFPDRTGIGPRHPAELRELLRQVRARGYATEDSEVGQGLRSVGAVVRDSAGWPIAAVAVTWAAPLRDDRSHEPIPRQPHDPSIAEEPAHDHTPAQLPTEPHTAAALDEAVLAAAVQDAAALLQMRLSR